MAYYIGKAAENAKQFKEQASNTGYYVGKAKEQANQLGIELQKPEPKGSFFGDLTRSILKPTVTLATRPFQAAKSIISTIRDPLKEPELDINLPFFSKIEAPKTGEDLAKDVGRAIQTVALAAPVTKLTGAATAGAKALGVGKAVAPAVGRIATGGGLGFAFDVGAGLEAGEGTKAFRPGLATGIGIAIPAGAEGIKFLKAKAFPKESVETLIGRITQGTKPEIFKAKKAMELIDTKGIKTYTNLKEVAKHKIGELSSKQDDILLNQGKIHKTRELVVREGGTRQNFVTTALKQLKELYSKTFDNVNLSRVNQIENKLRTQGLTTQEVNNIAREYGVEFGRKAFSKTGEPLTTVNAVGFENVRKGVKATARRFLPNNASKALDDNITNLFTLQRTAEKMERAVQKLSNKVKQRNILERLGRLAGHAVDVATGGLPRSFLTSFLPSNIGNKVMNSLDLERELARNLSRIEKLAEKGTDIQIMNFIMQLTKGATATTLIRKPTDQ